MSFQIQDWMDAYVSAVQTQFGGRIWLIGLQGSYGRGEATADSDIDVVLILDALSYPDLTAYSALLDTLPSREKICGFVSGRDELLAWEKSDLFQFCNDTTPILGSLDELMQTIQDCDIRRAIKLGACNIYHACAHNAVHEKSPDILKELYKAAAFTLQAIAYLQCGVFEKRQHRLPALLSGADREILEQRFRQWDSISPQDFAQCSKALLLWASHWIRLPISDGAHAPKSPRSPG